MTELEIAQLAARAAEDKKGHDVVILDLKGLSIIADYFVVCHGNSETQVQAIVDNIKDSLEKERVTVRGREGYDEARWVLVDVGDVVIHVFHRDEREFYNIERLWKDASVVSIH
ncbi:ribosome silencing factor [Aneurinibacillus sp. BA2021]|nr:ribosome silencing factor [Aneurinibacillus sp. BA2021]